MPINRRFHPPARRRRVLVTVGTVAASLVFAACSSSSSSTTKSGAQATLWVASGSASEKMVYQGSVDRFNTLGQGTIKMDTFQNDPYKLKLQTAMGAGQVPDAFFNFGGGSLKSYVDAGKVADLTSVFTSDPAYKKFLPSVLNAVTYGGKTYAVPIRGIQPVMLFTNKHVLAKYNLTAPTTWDELLSTISVLKDKGVIPIALAGASKWPLLMYEEYLVDRLGGPNVFANIAANKPNAWSDPAVIKANTMIQQLVDVGAFGESYSSTSYDGGQVSALLYTGKAAMQLMGSWEFAADLAAAPSFIKDGKLGYVSFPTVPGGKGDPKDIVGNPSTYLSASSSGNKSLAQNYFKQLSSDAYVDSLISIGDVPAVGGVEAKLSKAPNARWLLFNFDLAKAAPAFTQSWDQALAPAAAATLLDNLAQLFLKKITPEQFSANMDKTIG